MNPNMVESRRARAPFEAIKALREKIERGDPPLGPAVVLTDPRITDALGVSLGGRGLSQPGGCSEASVY